MAFWNRKKKNLSESLDLLESSMVPGSGISLSRTSKQPTREVKLRAYRIMERDAVISAALDLYASDSTQPSYMRGHTVWVEGSDSLLVNRLNSFLYDDVDIDSRVYNWAYLIARDGQLFLRINRDDSGRIFLEEIFDDGLYQLWNKGEIIGYYSYTDKVLYDKWAFIPFIAESGAPRGKIELRVPFSSGSKFTSSSMIECQYAVGESFLRGSVVAWQVLNAVEEMLLSARLGRSSVYNLVRIEVGSATRKEAEEIIEKAKKAFKTSEVIDLTSDFYSSYNTPLAANENIYIPTRDGIGNMTVESVGGNYDLSSAIDLDYFRNKLFASLKIPKAYLGFDGEATSVLGDNSLTRLDERYARTCKRLQSILISGIRKLLETYNHLNSTDEGDFRVSMLPPSSAEEATRRQEMTEKIAQARDIVDLAGQFQDQIDSTKLFSYVFNDVLGISSKDLDNSQVRSVNISDVTSSVTVDISDINQTKTVDISDINQTKTVDISDINQTKTVDISDIVGLEPQTFTIKLSDVKIQDGAIYIWNDSCRFSDYDIYLKEGSTISIRDYLIQCNLIECMTTYEVDRMDKSHIILVEYIGLSNHKNHVFTVKYDEFREILIELEFMGLMSGALKDLSIENIGRSLYGGSVLVKTYESRDNLSPLPFTPSYVVLYILPLYINRVAQNIWSSL